MKKLSIEEQKKVAGGYSEVHCREVQVLAEQMINDGVDDDALWDLWGDSYDTFC